MGASERRVLPHFFLRSNTGRCLATIKKAHINVSKYSRMKILPGALFSKPKLTWSHIFLTEIFTATENLALLYKKLKSRRVQTQKDEMFLSFGWQSLV